MAEKHPTSNCGAKARPIARKARSAMVLAVVLLAACSDSGGPTTQSATEKGLANTARESAQALIDEPAKFYDYLSAECRESISRSDFTGETMLGLGMFEGFYGFGFDELSVEGVDVVDFTGDSGSVRVKYVGPGGEPINDEASTEAWIYEDDRWVSTECATTGESGASEEVSTETALAWPAKFCQLSEGMTRTQVREIMGEPTSEFLDENSQDGYHAYQFQITVFYTAPRAQDPDPMKVVVQSLAADSTGQFTDMTLEDIALFPCADDVFDEATIDAARANSGG